MKKISFIISGMHCASCSARNEKSLKSIEGVSNAVVNFATGGAMVEYDESRASEHDLHAAVEKNGYTVSVGQDHMHHGAGSKKELQTTRNKAFAAIALSVPVLVLAMGGIRLPFDVFG